MTLRAALPRSLTALALAATALAGGAWSSAHAADPFTLVGIPEVEKMLSEPDVAVIDANPKDVYEKNHLPGAKHYRSAPFAQVLPADRKTRLVFYCASPT